MTDLVFMFLALKTKPGIEPRRFARLIEPEFIPTPKVSAEENDRELAETVESHNGAIIWEFEDNNPFALKDAPTKLTPQEFTNQWIGD